ncbi:nitric oxide reductase [Thiohalorhabdus denitrificans]|uniref:Nitric oxide reductase NorD protein n=1 Tax=Thiohalorhabdus denitrificans TaxID=381306 RepID=A0A0P9EPP3_9GAMM|nr:VWA domain-containing protein [Thiohalorhabdus denitrificans]KPV40456.1 nitric oxide reductase [Thiohalorhabdus denitrificans]SCY61298.1 nitric oxide reductase NorD protein [Thiohalorhabdus denitrificans]
MDPEEEVGKVWDRLISGAARTAYPEAAVTLDGLRPRLGLLFRALGGDPGLSIEAAGAEPHGARRSLLQRIAGSHRRVERAWADAEALRLPERIDLFPDAERNRDLYLWVAALAALDRTAEGPSGWERGPWLTARALARLPGMRARYARLAEAYLPLRPDPKRLPADEAAAERAVREALIDPRQPLALPAARRPPYPVALWLHPHPPRWDEPRAPAGDDGEPADPEGEGETRALEDRRRRRGQQVAMPERNSGLLLFPFDSILSWSEYLNVDRPTEEDEDLDNAASAADDLDLLSLARDNRRSASRLRFDLDLPSAANDDTPLGSGILLPEWDYRRGTHRPDHCRLQPMVALEAEPTPLPHHLHRTARRLRAQFQQLNPVRTWRKAQPDGTEIDLDAYERFAAERAAGQASGEPALYQDLRGGDRRLACLLLADLSLSTDTWVNSEARVIDVIRDSLFLFAESLAATGDAFALYGFSSRKREHVRFHVLKEFGERYGEGVRGRLAAIKPGFYTRMGTALRQATHLLGKRSAEQRLLLLLTDGKPNDMDQYEARYGVEDTRMAVREAREAGLQPFCVTIDRDAEDYLPHLFGSQGFVVIRTPEELPRRLPQLYAQLTQ